MNTDDSDIGEKELFYPEDYFQKLLINERRRTERFGRPFMLMLLDVGRLLKERRKEEEVTLQSLAFALNSSTREIDIKGWYLHNCLIGIICPEFNKADTKWAVDKLRQKLASFFDSQEAATMKIYCIMYPGPEEEHPGDHRPENDEKPYPKLHRAVHL
jgi:hypothetical protein